MILHEEELMQQWSAFSQEVAEGLMSVTSSRADVEMWVFNEEDVRPAGISAYFDLRSGPYYVDGRSQSFNRQGTKMYQMGQVTGCDLIQQAVVLMNGNVIQLLRDVVSAIELDGQKKIGIICLRGHHRSAAAAILVLSLFYPYGNVYLRTPGCHSAAQRLGYRVLRHFPAP